MKVVREVRAKQGEKKERKEETMKMKNKAGFTLVELMIVAAIIAILAAIVVPLLANNRERAVAAEGQNICGTLATAAKVYYAEVGTWPTYAQLPQLVRDEVGNAKYFDTFAIAGTFNDYTITVTADADAGALDNLTLILDEDGDWTGTISTRLGLQ